MKRLFLSALALQFLLLALLIWQNRPSYLFLNRIYDPKASVNKYAVCVVTHRWGTHIQCPTNPRAWSDKFPEMEYQYFLAQKQVEGFSLREKWQAY